jgi:hypothetical protein
MCFDMKLIRGLNGIVFHLLFISSGFAQLSPDSLLYKESISNLHRIYINEIGDNAQIYHGSEYIRNGQKATGFPYFESDNMLTGSVSYQGNIYTDLHLFYNLVSDDIIVNNYAQNALITLSPGNVDSFTIGAHRFLQLTTDKTNGLPKDGFYEQLSDGDPAMYVRREKRFVIGTGSEETKYIPYNNYLLKFNNVFYSVDSKKSLLDILKDQRDMLKKYIHTNKLDFKKNLESSLVRITIYYSGLKH